MPMKRVGKILLVNSSLLIGCSIALFIVPPSTPLKSFLFVCLGAAIFTNAVIFVRPAIRKGTASARRTDKFQSITIWVTLFILLAWILAISSSYFRKLFP